MSLTIQPRILCVDDELFILNALNRHLRSRGEVITTPSASEALEILSRQTIDLIITDMRMPEMSGLELLKRVKDMELQNNPGQILLTGNSEVQDTQEMLITVGANNILRKPWVKEELVSAVDQLLKARLTGL
ncbi:MAG TPA: response regulator [Marinobacterium sp.]|nr:response regulator [Marinobacterium sp.]